MRTQTSLTVDSADNQGGVKYGSAFCWVGCFATLILIAFHKIILPSPILASDEYAYLAAVLDAIDGEKRNILDPMLQAVYLPAFTWFGVVAAKLTSAIVPVYKGLNFLFFIGASLLLLSIARTVVPRKNLSVLALLLCISPISAYVAYIMPESLYYFLFTCVAAAIVIILPRTPQLGIALAGIATAALALTKPHALAIFAATLATLLSYRAVYEKTLLRGLISGSADCILYLTATLIAMIALNRATSGTLILNPYHLIGEFYRPVLQSAADPAGLSSRLGTMLRNGAGHAVIFLAITAIPIYCAILGWFRPAHSGITNLWSNRSSWLPEKRKFILVAFALLCLMAMVLMTINFTAQVAHSENGQVYRLHGRYYTFAFPLFFIILAMASNAGEQSISRIKRALMILAFVSGGWIIYNKFTIFPWDFPELVLLTKLDGLFSKIIAKLFIAALLVALLAPKHLSVKTFFFRIWGGIFFASFIIMLVWQKTQTSAFAREIDAGLSAHLLLGNSAQQSVVVTGDERYGRMSYFLFNLASKPKVIAAQQPVENLSNLTEGSSWIFSLYPQDLHLSNALATGSLGSVRFYRQDHAAPYTLEKLKLWSGEPIHLNFGTGRDDGLISGGNPSEPWGTWTATETSTINLPALVHGKVRLSLDGWVVPERSSDALIAKIGDAEATLHFLDHREQFSVILNVTRPTRELVLSGIKPWQPNPWDRPLAVAVVKVDIEPAE